MIRCIAWVEILLATQPLKDGIISYTQTYKIYNFINKTTLNYKYKQQLNNKIRNLENEWEFV